MGIMINLEIIPNKIKNKEWEQVYEDLVEEEDSCTDFIELSSFDKLNYLNRQNRYFLIRKETWDYITEQVENNDIINRIYALLNVKADEMSVNNICRMAFWNIELLKNYFLKNMINQ